MIIIFRAYFQKLHRVINRKLEKGEYPVMNTQLIFILIFNQYSSDILKAQQFSLSETFVCLILICEN